MRQYSQLLTHLSVSCIWWQSIVLCLHQHYHRHNHCQTHHNHHRHHYRPRQHSHRLTHCKNTCQSVSNQYLFNGGLFWQIQTHTHIHIFMWIYIYDLGRHISPYASLYSGILQGKNCSCNDDTKDLFGHTFTFYMASVCFIFGVLSLCIIFIIFDIASLFPFIQHILVLFFNMFSSQA